MVGEHEGEPTALTLYMSSMMDDALRDFLATPGPRPVNLYPRFIGWVLPGTTS